MMSIEPSLVAYVAEQCEAVRVDVHYVGVADWAFPDGEPKWSGDPCKPGATLQITIGDAGTWTVSPCYDFWAKAKVVPTSLAVGQAVMTVDGVAMLLTRVEDRRSAGR